MRLLGSDILTSDATTMNVSDLPGDAVHLRIFIVGKNDDTTLAFANTNIRFNDDTGSNYSWRQLIGILVGGNDVTYSTTNCRIGRVTSSTTGHDADAFGAIEATVPLYAGTDHDKHISSMCGYMDAADSTSDVLSYSSAWHSTSAITKVSATLDSTHSFKAGSALYVFGFEGVTGTVYPPFPRRQQTVVRM